MKIQYKASAVMTLFGIAILLILSLGYDSMRHEILIEKEMKNNANIVKELSLHLESHLKEKATIAATIASAPVMKTTLIASNSNFSVLNESAQKKEINRRNRLWKENVDINDPFIQKHLTNPVAEYLKYHQQTIPAEYGEIFLTNKYGVMIATTGKLTTLAHAHKYWWQACYNGGQGRIFLDDRGFDLSVKGYVLGVVIPIKDKNEVIGILKCNINIKGPLTDLVQEFSLRHHGRVQIARTGGLIIAEQGVIPLSTSLSSHIVDLLQDKKAGASLVDTGQKNMLIAHSPVNITTGSKSLGFGGSQESLDHIKGNKGEAWHMVLSVSEKYVIAAAHETTTLIVVVGAIFTLVTALIALVLGKWIANPIVKLSKTAGLIGQGRLDERADVLSNDEIGFLSQTLNRMAQNLQDTMASRDDLIHEIQQRKKVEAEKKKTIVELETALNEIKTLEGIVPICMHCKGIRDDNGYWNQLEEYMVEHSDAEFTHGICDKCMEKHYPPEEE